MFVKILKPMKYRKTGTTMATLPVGWTGSLPDKIAEKAIKAGTAERLDGASEKSPAQIKPETGQGTGTGQLSGQGSGSLLTGWHLQELCNLHDLETGKGTVPELEQALVNLIDNPPEFLTRDTPDATKTGDTMPAEQPDEQATEDAETTRNTERAPDGNDTDQRSALMQLQASQLHAMLDAANIAYGKKDNKDALVDKYLAGTGESS